MAAFNPDLDMVTRIAQVALTNKELAVAFDVNERTIERSLKKKDFKEAVERGRSKLVYSLRRKQYELALQGNTAMLQFLGRHLLNQTLTGDDRYIELDFPENSSVAERSQITVDRLARGKISPERAKMVLDCLATAAKIEQDAEIENRINDLESIITTLLEGISHVKEANTQTP